ncbi:hypothetical protein ONZ45_g5847 [Pleurotus djamor]|nr:hypothetical protein ONZ45_g5847 [Pleurotus djamor]
MQSTCSSSPAASTVFVHFRVPASYRHLPIELWHIVILDLGHSPYRNGLRLLLTVSRAIHSMVIPLIYESIVIDGQDMAQSYNRFQRDSQPSTYLWYSRVKLLNSTLIVNPNLAKHIKTLVGTIPDSEPSNPICHLLPRLTNLKSLHIVHEEDRDIQALLSTSTTAPPMLTLRHFACRTVGHADSTPLKAFLLSQRSSLTFLSLSAGTEVITTLPPLSLEKLHTFKSVYPDKWDTVVIIAPGIQHLETYSFNSHWVRDPNVVFKNLVSLKITVLYKADVLKLIGPCLQSLAWLHLSLLYDTKQHVRTSRFLYHYQLSFTIVYKFAVDDFMNISSPRLSYIHFGRKESVTPPAHPRCSRNDLQPLYDRHPCLRIVDIAYRDVHTSSLESSQGAKVSRYFRDQTKLTREDVIVPSPWIFEGWWEPLKAELELE